jgi:hypothetical protein
MYTLRATSLKCDTQILDCKHVCLLSTNPGYKPVLEANLLLEIYPSLPGNSPDSGQITFFSHSHGACVSRDVTYFSNTWEKRLINILLHA